MESFYSSNLDSGTTTSSSYFSLTSSVMGITSSFYFSSFFSSYVFYSVFSSTGYSFFSSTDVFYSVWSSVGTFTYSTWSTIGSSFFCWVSSSLGISLFTTYSSLLGDSSRGVSVYLVSNGLVISVSSKNLPAADTFAKKIVAIIAKSIIFFIFEFFFFFFPSCYKFILLIALIIIITNTNYSADFYPPFLFPQEKSNVFPAYMISFSSWNYQNLLRRMSLWINIPSHFFFLMLLCPPSHKCVRVCDGRNKYCLFSCFWPNYFSILASLI